MNRREALKRTALLLGVAAHPAAITEALAQATRPDGRRYLTSGQFATVSALADRLLPRTETPGALDAGVPAFIDVVFGKYYQPDQATNLAQGLENVNAAARARTGRAFAELEPPEQDAQLTALAATTDGDLRRFWTEFRNLALTGFFTSEVSAQQVLNHDPVPGGWEPDIPVASVNNVAWFE